VPPPLENCAGHVLQRLAHCYPHLSIPQNINGIFLKVKTISPKKETIPQFFAIVSDRNFL
jgi:hypothetical protein